MAFSENVDDDDDEEEEGAGGHGIREPESPNPFPLAAHDDEEEGAGGHGIREPESPNPFPLAAQQPGHELCYSSALAVQLQMHARDVGFFHQTLVAGGGIADILWVACERERVGADAGALPYAIIECGTSTFISKQRQLFSYAVNMFCTRGLTSRTATDRVSSKTNPCVLGMYLQFKNGMPVKWTLVGYCVVLDQKRALRLSDVVLGHGKITDGSSLAAPFAAMKLCVTHRGWPHSPFVPDTPANTVIDEVGKRVLKVFGKGTDRKPNRELYAADLKAVVYEAALYTVLDYKYVEGSHTAGVVKQVIQVLDELRALHTKGYCHGDVRGSNIVFGEASHLIDLDFAAQPKHRATYPTRYAYENLGDVTRHPDAKPCQRMQMAHDVAAMHSILACYKCPRAAKAWEAALALLSGQAPSLDKCLVALHHISALTLVKLSGNAGTAAGVPFKEQGTGSPPQGDTASKKRKSKRKRAL